MSTTRRSLVAASMIRRPSGPRCHGGASSLLRLGYGALPQRAARAPAWRELADDAAVAAVEHIVGWPSRGDRVACLS